jgi:hypothetical protein
MSAPRGARRRDIPIAVWRFFPEVFELRSRETLVSAVLGGGRLA